MLFSNQTVFCQACGKLFETTFTIYGGHVCSEECFDIIETKKTCFILGKKYTGKLITENSKDEEYLNQYKKTINCIDDYFEYTNESTQDRKFIHEQLDLLTIKIKKIGNN